MRVRTFRKTAAILVTIIMAVGIFAGSLAGCEKEGDKGASGTATKTATAVTTIKATTAAISGTASAAKTSAASSVSVTTFKSESTETAAVTEGVTEEETIEEGDGEVDEVQIDLKGKEIIIAWHDKGRVPYADATDAKLPILWKNAKLLEEKYNCKFVFEASASSTAHITSIATNAFAGTEYRTVIFAIEPWVFPSLVEGGYFLAMDDYIDKESDLWKYQIEGITKWGDKHWGFNEVQGLYGGQNTVFYDEALTQREGIPDIWDMAMKFNWTWNEFTQVAVQTTKDLDGDGIVDQWGLIAQPQHLAETLIYANNGRFFNTDGGKTLFALDNPESIKALQFMSDLFNVYKVIPYDATLSRVKNYLGRVAMSVMTVPSSSASVWMTPEQGDSIRVAPMPLGPDSYTDKYMSGYRTQHEMFLIPSSITEKEEVVTVVAEWFRRNHIDLRGDDRWNSLRTGAMIWLKNVNWVINVPRLITINEMGYGVKEALSVFAPLQAQVTANIFNKIISLETPVTAALAANKDLMQSYIDAKFK